MKRKLPIGGVQTFSHLREKYDVYVDKTMFIYEMASRYKAVFLSRPRRFGKSLLCSTIASLFQGQKDLFEGLAISKTDWEWKEYPVIHIDLSSGNFTESNGLSILREKLNFMLKHCAQNHGLNIDFGEHPFLNFTKLITELSGTIDKAVIIIDEYDNPLLNTIDKPEINKDIREELKGFFSVIKQYDAHIQFAFVTGITKFAQVSVFSGFNQPKDISMAADYCDICGITQEELEKNFAPEIDMYASKYGGRENYLNKLWEYYNGYFFTEDKKSVYNTYGILNHFDSDAKFVKDVS